MKADYHRYLTEFAVGENKTEHASNAEKSYQSASQKATESLSPTHPIRLGLALNHSVFLYEVQGNPETACDLAKTAYDEALVQLDSLSEESYKESTMIMKLLHDNLTLWMPGVVEAEAS